jgi:hypothetical protein
MNTFIVCEQAHLRSLLLNTTMNLHLELQVSIDLCRHLDKACVTNHTLKDSERECRGRLFRAT